MKTSGVPVTSRDLHNLVKRHATSEALMTRYSCSSQEELFTKIREVTPGECRLFVEEIRKADKQAAKRRSAKKANDEQSSEVVVVGSDEESSASVEVEATTPEETTSVVSTFEALKKLKQEELTMSSELIALECSHKKLRTDRHTLVRQLEKVREDLQRLFASLEQSQNQAEEIVRAFNQKGEEMSILSLDIRERKKHLDEVRQQINSMASQVVIYVYSGGTFELESPLENTPTVGDNEIDLISFVAEHQEVVECLTLKQIGALAKLEKLLKKLLPFGISHEVIFDDLAMQEAFNNCCCETQHN